jgi:RNA-directed DNA polymerase
MSLVNRKAGSSHETKGPNMKNKGDVSMSFEPVKSPPGGAVCKRVMEEQPLENTMLESILAFENIEQAWKKVKSNRGAPGVDEVTITAFPDLFKPRWSAILDSLYAGTYKPSPVLRVEIPKSDGSKRPLGIPTVLDRLIQQAIAQVLGRVFDPEFSDSSHGFRPRRSAHHGVRQVQRYVRAGRHIAVDMDLAKFFDKVNHDILMSRVSLKVTDKRVLRLIGRYLRAGVVNKGRLEATSKGVPQGSPLSPLLANIILDDLDRELERRGHCFARYADDFIILVRSKRAGLRVMQSIRKFLSCSLDLEVNEKKSKVASMEQCSFLGFTIIHGKIRWTANAYQEFKRQCKLLTGRSWSVSMNYRLKKLASYLRGWINYYGITEYYRPIPVIDEWLRRRLRMCYLKQWRKPRTRIRNLIRLGANKVQAIKVGLSRKGPWRLARTPASQFGMSVSWLKDQGLVSVKDLWVSIHYPATARYSS